MKRGILRFVSMLFLIFEKGDEQKNCARYFEIRKYAFFNFWKGDEQKTVPGILRFVSMLFNLIINVIIFSIKRVIVVFVCMYAFYEYCYYKKGYISIFRFVGIPF